MTYSRIKPKYNAIPTKREREYHLWLMREYPCACGCGCPSTVVHHPLTRHPEQRWRRDHEFVVPMNGICHMKLHRIGSEKAAPFGGLSELAFGLRLIAIEEYRL